jgi:hypothetical protein
MRKIMAVLPYRGVILRPPVKEVKQELPEPTLSENDMEYGIH